MKPTFAALSRAGLSRAALIASVLAPGAIALAAHAAEAAPAEDGVMLVATLSGEAEVPTGDPDATGSFTAHLDPKSDELCYELIVSDFDPPTAAHIHVGPVGQNGGHVVVLDAPEDGSSNSCTTVAPDLAAKLIASPQDYYVNVHNEAYPAGGLRGQLSK